MNGPRRRIVLVTGIPGAGKTTLAIPLAAELGFGLLSKDRIKETLCDGLAVPDPVDLAMSRRLGGAAMELLWALAADATDVVLEANFRPHSEYERAKIAGLGGRLVEVHCSCPVPVAAQRYARRAGSAHRVHAAKTMPPEFAAEFDRPVGLGELIVAGTTAPVDVAGLAEQVRSRLSARRLHDRTVVR